MMLNADSNATTFLVRVYESTANTSNSAMMCFSVTPTIIELK